MTAADTDARAHSANDDVLACARCVDAPAVPKSDYCRDCAVEIGAVHLDERARLIAAGLTKAQREMMVGNLDCVRAYGGSPRRCVYNLIGKGLLFDGSSGRGEWYVGTDLGRAVARVLASQEVDRG